MDSSLSAAEIFRPLVQGWLSKLEQAKKGARKEWLEEADDCLLFFAGAAGFMWDQKYRSRFFLNGGAAAPRFQMTMNKAFEFVAIKGPDLFFQTPHRAVKPIDSRQMLPLEALFPAEQPQQGPDGQPMPTQAQQFAQFLQQQDAQETGQAKLVSALMQTWLNWTPREMPYGGLEAQAKMAIQDALITGRGLLWAKPYVSPGGMKVTTLCRDNPKNLISDPDFRDIEHAKWICRTVVEPYWEAERRFGLPEGSLKNKASLESEWAIGERMGSEWSENARRAGQTNDLIIYHEFYSKMGPGTRMTGMEMPIGQHLERVVGDYAYIVVSPNVSYPLNVNPRRMQQGATDDEVRSWFQWPFESWRANGRWPMERMDFYPHTERAYPMAPISPGMGELKFINIFISHMCNRLWSSTRDFVVVNQAALKVVEQAFKDGLDMTIIGVPPLLNNLDDMVKFMQQPQMNADAWRIIEWMSAVFDKRVGLTEFDYSANAGGTQSRTAEDAANKRVAAGVRPKYMRQCVSQWISKASSLEAMCARAFVGPEDVARVMGKTRGQLWGQFVATKRPEDLVHEFEYTVAAADMRPPDKDRDVANVNQMLGIMGPILDKHADVTTDTTPLNNIWKLWGEVSDQDVSGVITGPRQPPAPTPEMQAQQQAMMQLEQQKVQVEVQKGQLQLQAIGMKSQADMAKVQIDAAAQQQSLAAKAQEGELDLVAKMAEMEFDAEAAEQNRRQDQRQFDQDMDQDATQFNAKIKQEEKMGEIKAKQAAKPKPKPKDGK